MSEEVRDIWSEVEIMVIPPNESRFDLIERVLYENKAPFAIRIGLGHTVRKVTLVLIDKATEEDEQKSKLKAMEGEIIE